MKKFNITVNGTAYEVEVEEVKSAVAAPKAAPAAPKAAPAPAAPAAPAAPKKAAVAAGAGEHSIDAPMPGKIVKKMQNEIAADADGVVKSFNVAAGQSVKAHESLVILG